MRYTTYRLYEYVKGTQVDRSKYIATFGHVDAHDRKSLDVHGMNLAQVIGNARFAADTIAQDIARAFFGDTFKSSNVYDNIAASFGDVVRLHDMDDSDYIVDRNGTVSDAAMFGVTVHARIVGNVYRHGDKTPHVRAIVVDTWTDDDTDDKETYTIKCDRNGNISVKTWGFAAAYNRFIAKPLARHAERLSMTFREKHGTSATFKYRLESVANGIATSGMAR